MTHLCPHCCLPRVPGAQKVNGQSRVQGSVSLWAAQRGPAGAEHVPHGRSRLTGTCPTPTRRPSNTYSSRQHQRGPAATAALDVTSPVLGGTMTLTGSGVPPSTGEDSLCLSLELSDEECGHGEEHLSWCCTAPCQVIGDGHRHGGLRDRLSWNIRLRRLQHRAWLWQRPVLPPNRDSRDP